MIEFLTSTDALIVYLIGAVIVFLTYVDELSLIDALVASMIAAAWPIWIPVMFLKSMRVQKWL